MLLALLLALACLLSCSNVTPSGTPNRPKDPDDSDEKDDWKDENKDDSQKLIVNEIGDFSEGLASISTNQGYGFIDTKGNIVIEPTYAYASKFTNGIALVKQNGQYGYINTKGELIIDTIYEKADSVFNTLALVTKDGVKQYINKQGQTVFFFTGEEVAIGEYSNGYFWVETLEELISGNVHTVTYYKENGQVAFSLQDATAIGKLSSFNEWGYTLINIPKTNPKAEGWGNSSSGWNVFINTSGEIVDFEGRNEYSSFGENQMYTALLDDNTSAASYGGLRNVYVVNEGIHNDAYWIDFEHLKVSSVPYTNVHHIGNGYHLGPWYDKYGYSDYENKYVSVYREEKILVFSSIEGLENVEFCAVSHFVQDHKDLFLLFLKSSSGVYFSAIVDADGNYVLKPNKNFWVCSPEVEYAAWKPSVSADTYQKMFNFSSGLCLAKDPETELFGYIDIQGNWVIEPQYEEDQAGQFSDDGDDAVAVINGSTVINRKGEVVFAAGEQ